LKIGQHLAKLEARYSGTFFRTRCVSWKYWGIEYAVVGFMPQSGLCRLCRLCCGLLAIDFHESGAKFSKVHKSNLHLYIRYLLGKS